MQDKMITVRLTQSQYDILCGEALENRTSLNSLMLLKCGLISSVPEGRKKGRLLKSQEKNLFARVVLMRCDGRPNRNNVALVPGSVNCDSWKARPIFVNEFGEPLAVFARRIKSTRRQDSQSLVADVFSHLDLAGLFPHAKVRVLSSFRDAGTGVLHVREGELLSISLSHKPPLCPAIQPLSKETAVAGGA